MLFIGMAALPAPAQASPNALEAEAVERLYAWHEHVRRDPAAFGLTASAVPWLRSSPELAELAQRSSRKMADAGVLQHDPAINLTVTRGSRIGNNIGRTGPGVRSSAAVRAAGDRLARAWLTSTAHRQQIVDRAYTHIGIGVAIDGAGNLWATVVFQRLDTARDTDPSDRPLSPLDIDAACAAPGAQEPPRFRDVNGTHRQAVECLSERGVVKGRTATTFAPDRELTRAQVSMLLDRLLTELDVPLPRPPDVPFDDVELDSTAGPAIARLAAAGILPQEQERFAPGKTVTRGELAVLLDATLSSIDTGHTSGRARTFRDVVPTAGHAEAIGRVAEAGLLIGTQDGRFEPHLGLRRDHAAAAIARLLAHQSR